MTTTLKNFLKSFDQLKQKDKKEAAREIALRLGELDYPPLTDEEIDSIAQDTFLRIDREEQKKNGQSKTRRGVAR